MNWPSLWDLKWAGGQHVSCLRRVFVFQEYGDSWSTALCGGVAICSQVRCHGAPGNSPSEGPFQTKRPSPWQFEDIFTRFFPNSRTRSFQRLILCILAINHCNDGNGHAQPRTICKTYFQRKELSVSCSLSKPPLLQNEKKQSNFTCY